MARSRGLQVAGALAVVLVPVYAQDAFQARLAAVRRAQPTGVELQLSVPKTRFYMGEMVPLTLSFSARERGAFLVNARLQDHVGRVNMEDEFVVDPASMVEDPLRGLPGESGGMGGISAVDAILGPDKPFQVERTLNEWVRFRAPGTYRVYVISHRARQGDPKLSDEELRMSFNRSRADVASNVLTLEVVAAPAAWVASQIAEATAILDAPVKQDEANRRAREQAGLTLRYLNTIDSLYALAKRLPASNDVGTSAMVSGLLASGQRAELLARLQALLGDPDQPISPRYIYMLAQLAVLVESGGVMPPYPIDAAQQQAFQAETQRRQQSTEAKRSEFVEALLSSLPEKRGEARRLTREALLAEADGMASRPTWLPRLVADMVADFRALPAMTQRDLLESRWHLLREANVRTLLEDLVLNPMPQAPGSGEVNDLALRRLYELDPVRGRELILAELKRPEGSRFNDKTLLLLPDETLPELNEVLVAQSSRGLSPPALRIVRYATGDIVKQVEAGYLAFHAQLDRQKLPHCPFPLAFYFLKYDPEFGEREIRNAFTNGPCYDMVNSLDTIGVHAWSPALERLAIEYINSSAPVAVKRGAAEALGKYGSPAVQARLWETMEYFRGWWKDQEALLTKPEGREGLTLERALRIALAEANGWVLDDEQLRRLLTLCSSGECRGAVQNYVNEARSPKQVGISVFFGGDVRIRVAHYNVTEATLMVKLAQFPPGALFRLGAVSEREDDQRARTRVEAAILEAGHHVIH